MDLELINFKICPFAQRAVITLRKKEVPYRITYIDSANPPDWFQSISPVGKTPVLRVNNSQIIFESAVISEFIDEITPPTLQPRDPLERALNRAWAEFGSDCLATQIQMLKSGDEATFRGKQRALKDKLNRVDGLLDQGPYFNGTDFSLVDATYAPLFMRLVILIEKGIIDDAIFQAKTAQWSNELLKLPAVRNSVVEDFRELFLANVRKMDGFAATRLADASSDRGARTVTRSPTEVS